jgi:hypothetical protein
MLKLRMRFAALDKQEIYMKFCVENPAGNSSGRTKFR